MKKLFGAFIILGGLFVFDANGYQVLSSRELGSGDAKNQNVVVKCTTDAGRLSNQTCTIRRYARCTGTGNAKTCSGWNSWKDLRNPGKNFNDWRPAAAECCKRLGLR